MNPSPSIAGLSDIEALERVPLEQRDLPSSTYELLQRSAQRHGQHNLYDRESEEADQAG